MKKVLLILTVMLFLFCDGGCRGKDILELDFDFVINNTLADGAGKKLRVIILAGQSNATGCAHTSLLKNKVSEEEYSRYADGYGNVLINYNTENGTNKSEGFVRTSVENASTFGPEIGLAEVLDKEEENFIILKYTYGGTNLYEQWNKDNPYLFKGLLKFVDMSLNYLQQKDYQATVVSFLWMQGESDAVLPHALNYYCNTKLFAAAIREKFGDIQFVDAGISDYWQEYQIINDAKKRFGEEAENNVFIDTIASGLSCKEEPADKPDLAHYDSLSQIELGRLFAKAVLSNN